MHGKNLDIEKQVSQGNESSMIQAQGKIPKQGKTGHLGLTSK